MTLGTKLASELVAQCGDDALAQRRDVLVGQRAVGRAELLRERERRAPLPHLGAAVDVEDVRVGEQLADAHLFDVYRGAQVGEGRTSLALALQFRAPDRTLSDEDVAPLRDRIVAALRDELGGELRA